MVFRLFRSGAWRGPGREVTVTTPRVTPGETECDGRSRSVPERRARSSAPHRTAGTPDRRGRRPATKPDAVPVTQPHTVPDTADQQQADYFMRLLTGRRGLIDQRLDGYRQKIAKAEAKATPTRWPDCGA